MKENKNPAAGEYGRVVSILTNGLMRCVENIHKSSNIGMSDKNKSSENVSKELGFPKDKSVSEPHEN